MLMKIILELNSECVVEWLGLILHNKRTKLTDMSLLEKLQSGVEITELEYLSTTVPEVTASQVLKILHQRRLLQWRLVDQNGSTVATARPLSANEPWPEFPMIPGGDLSRFTSSRMRGGSWVIESGASRWEVELPVSGMAQLVAAQKDLLTFMAPFDLLIDRDQTASLTMWEPNDLMLATRSSMDLAPEHVGGTFRFRQEMEPTAFYSQKLFSGTLATLPPPQPLPEVKFSSVVENRRSIREFHDRRLSGELVSTLLWHTLRAREVQLRNPEIDNSYDAAFKSVPSSGGVAAIDAWLMIRDVDGIDSGTWWYDPINHELRRTSDSIFGFDGASAPQFAILLATRHERLAWKYERLALHLALCDAGVVIHALQLTATALGLGAYPIGGISQVNASEHMSCSLFTHMPICQVLVGHPVISTPA